MIGSLIVVVFTLSHVTVFNDLMDEMAARRNSLSAFEVSNLSEAVGGMFRDVVEAASVCISWMVKYSVCCFVSCPRQVDHLEAILKGLFFEVS